MLRVSEIYTSVQGEGPRVGELTQFVRFAGCNMRCPLWPCDTEHAINPAIWRIESVKHDAMELSAQLAPAVPNLCLTGGEPFMQPAVELQEFVEIAGEAGHRFEFFTNGSFEFPDWAISNCGIMMDWKLSGSGEAMTNVHIRRENALRLRRHHGIKFVVTGDMDLDEAQGVYRNLIAEGCTAQFWVGAAWDRIDNQTIIDYMVGQELDWKLNVQIHKYIWPADERGV